MLESQYIRYDLILVMFAHITFDIHKGFSFITIIGIRILCEW